MDFENIVQLPNAWTVAAERFGVHLFEGRLTVDDMVTLEQAGDTWMRRNPGRLVELVVIYPSDDRMQTDERQKMAQLIKRWESLRVASATVILAEGILGSLHRSVLTGLMMMAPAAHPAKVFAKVPDAVSFLAPHVRSLGSRATDATLRASVQRLQSAFEARGSR